ncbi:MAG: AbrB/MazE/SpoVT family DNA-binding domain-containing protein [Propionibacteriaceae bacterium]|jgi:AbrB family looped-hinge helix DNA binding protein|nr:AbrB/MazE/SpoVT family DNA-binding domain-containing protein [Propionibacteriaceae bacterium]
MSTPLVETARVLPKGQITIPKAIREALGVGTDDRVVLVWDGQKATMMNPALYAMQWLGDKVRVDVEASGFTSDEDIADYVTQMRREARER